MKPKIIANYLPQFHEVAENNERRGEWFTEWSNVRKAKPLFHWHNQPRVPLDGKYYNILDPEIRKRQGELAKEYWIDWFCYYHYWFKWWKLLLEKPTELMLKDGYPDIPFCFSRWNGNWARTREWKSEKILMLQEYWDEQEREDHFNYLLPFFQSPLYIRKDNKPIFVIHYSKHMQDILDQMIQKRNELAIKNGIEWIYIVETISSAQWQIYSQLSSAVLEFQPLHSIGNVFSLSYIKNIIKHIINRISKKILEKWILINRVSYEETRKIICNRDFLYKWKDIIFWWFVSRDNSPRKGKDSLIMNYSTPKKFEKYFEKYYKKAKSKNVDFIFLNARNEWAEWAYLEPDTLHQFWYLEAIKKIVYNNK